MIERGREEMVRGPYPQGTPKHLRGPETDDFKEDDD
jgi:hypothetical protein